MIITRSLETCLCALLALSTVATGSVVAGDGQVYSAGRRWDRRVPIMVSTDGAAAAEMVGCVRVPEIRSHAPDFNPKAFVVVDPTAASAHPLGIETGGCAVASQADDLDGDGYPDEIAFLCEAPGLAPKKLYLYYRPTGVVTTRYPKRTDGVVPLAVRDAIRKRRWVLGRLIGWESEQIAFALESSSIGVLGKARRDLQLRRFTGSGGYPVNLDAWTAWGGWLAKPSGGGCGGLVRCQDGDVVSLGRCKGAELICSGPVRTIMEFQWADSHPVVLRVVQEANANYCRMTVRNVTSASELCVGLSLDGSLASWENGGVSAVVRRKGKQAVACALQVPLGMERSKFRAGKEMLVRLPGNAPEFTYGIVAVHLGAPADGAVTALVREAVDAAVRCMGASCTVAFGTPEVTSDPIRPPRPGWHIVNPARVSSALPALYTPSRYALPQGLGYQLDTDLALLPVAPIRPLTTAPWQPDQRGRERVEVASRDGRLFVRNGIGEWVFDDGGLKAMRLNGAAQFTEVSCTHSVPRQTPSVAGVDTVTAVVYGRDGGSRVQYLFYAGSPIWEVMAPREFSLRVQSPGETFLTKFSYNYGAAVAATGDHDRLHVPRVLYYSSDWAAVRTPGCCVWTRPTASAPRLVLRRDADAIVIQANTLDLARDGVDQYGPLVAAPWNNRERPAPGPKALYQFGLCRGEQEGRDLLLLSERPLVVQALPDGEPYAAMTDIDVNGSMDTIYVQDANGNGPDLVTDRWYWDMDSDGSVQSSYQFRDADGDGTPDELLAYADFDNFLRDGVLNEKELRLPMVVFRDQTRDGVFTDHSPFCGGIVARDRWDVQMYRGSSGYVHKPGYALSDLTDAFDPQCLRTSGVTSLDLDSDEDWDISFNNQLHAAHLHPVPMVFLYMDYSDANTPVGVMIDPTSGYFFPKNVANYASQKGNLMAFWDRATACGSGKYKGAHYGCNDWPQGCLNMDDDLAPEVRWYSTNHIDETGNVQRAQLVRWAFDIDNDNRGVRRSPYLGTECYGWDFCIHPATFGTDAVRKRHPVFPTGKSTFADPFGNSIVMSGPMLPRHWDGTALAVLDDSGQPSQWLEAWQWALDTRWDQVGIIYYPSPGPEAFQTVAPRPCRYECDIDRDIDYFCYYNPLDGQFHFRNVDFSYRVEDDPDVPAAKRRSQLLTVCDQRATRTYEIAWRRQSRPAIADQLTPWWYDGWNCEAWTHDVDFCRAALTRYECYFDNDGDGYLDTVLEDRENDGLFERRRWYDASSKTILTVENGRAALANGVALSFPGFLLLPQNYAALSELANSKRATGASLLRTDVLDWRVRCGVANGDLRDLSTGAIPVIGVSVHHTGGDAPWADLMPEGHSRLFTALSRFPTIIRRVDSTLDRHALEPLDALVIAGGLRVPFQDEELDAISEWVTSGGHLLVCGQGNDTRAFNSLGKRLGTRMSSTDVSYTERDDGEILASRSPENRPAQPLQFGATKDLFEGVYKLYFDGRAFAQARDSTVLISFRNQPIAALAAAGRGEVYLFPNDMLANKYTSFARQMYIHGAGGVYGQAGGADVWLQPDNNVLLDNLARHVFRRMSRVSAVGGPLAPGGRAPESRVGDDE